MLSLIDKSETAGLRFDSQEDALNFGRQCVEDSVRWFASNDLDCTKRYEKSEIELVVEFFPWVPSAYGKKYHLLFYAVPNVIDGNTIEVSTSNAASNRELTPQHTSSEGSQDSVLISGTKLVQCGEHLIASWVRFERAKKRVNLLRDILASSPHVVFKSSGRSGHGKVSILGINNARRGSNSEHSVVEYGSKIRNSISGDRSERIGNYSSEFDLASKLAEALSIRLEGSFVGLEVEEIVDSFAKIGDVFFSPR